MKSLSFQNSQDTCDIYQMCKSWGVKKIVLSLRNQRNNGMVQTREQFGFIYKALLDSITDPTPRVPEKYDVLAKFFPPDENERATNQGTEPEETNRKRKRTIETSEPTKRQRYEDWQP